MLRFTLPALKELDINDLKLAMINFIISQQDSSSFSVLIDDINANNAQTVMQDNLEILKKFAIDTSNTIYKSQNLNIYRQLATNLIKDKKAYLCFCNKTVCNCPALTDSEIQNLLKEGNKSSIKIDNFTIIKEDGNPTKIFTDAIDDMSIATNKVILNGEEKNIAKAEEKIHKMLNYNSNIEYFYIPKLKSSNTIRELLQEGILPDAIISYLLIPKQLDKVTYLPQIIKDLKLSQVKNTEFNIEDLKKVNKVLLKKMDSKKLSSIFGFADNSLGDMLKLFLDKASTIKELDEIMVSIFTAKKCDKKMKLLAEIIKNAPMISEFDEFVKYAEDKSNLSGNELQKILARIITGRENENKLPEIYKYINPYLLEVAKCI